MAFPLFKLTHPCFNIWYAFQDVLSAVGKETCNIFHGIVCEDRHSDGELWTSSRFGAGSDCRLEDGNLRGLVCKGNAQRYIKIAGGEVERKYRKK